MNFYEKYLRGVDAGKVWTAVAVPTIALYNGLLFYKIPQIISFAICAVYVLFSLIQVLIIPKTPMSLAHDPTIQKAVVSVASPLLLEAAKQLNQTDKQTSKDEFVDPSTEALRAVAIRMGLSHLLKDDESV